MRFTSLVNKAKGGGWTRGPRGGMRRRLRSGQWEYRKKNAPPKKEAKPRKPKALLVEQTTPRRAASEKFDLHPGLPPEPGKKTLPKEKREESGKGRPAAKYEGTRRRVAAAESHEIRLTKEELKAVLKKGHYSILSAGRNPADPDEAELPWDDPVFVERHAALKAELESLGFPHTEIEGHYGLPEMSFFVIHGDTARTKGPFMIHHKSVTEHAAIRNLGEKYNQESVIHSKDGRHELHYTSGENLGRFNPGSGYKFVPNAKDYFTVVYHEGVAMVRPDMTKLTEAGISASKFTLEFNWDKFEDFANAILKAIRALRGG